MPRGAPRTGATAPPQAARQAAPPPGQWPVVAAVSLGGGLGAAARYGVTLLWPTAAGSFPATTLAVNAAGCALMGVLMALITARPAPHRLLRPFLGTGVLGGFTTFSAYALDIRQLLEGGQPALAAGYLAATAACALAGVWCAFALTRRAFAARRERGAR